jgi:hypothetical protein
VVLSLNLRSSLISAKINYWLNKSNTVRPRFWQPIFKASAALMANIMLMCSDYGNKGFSKTPNLVNDFYARISALILAKFTF